ncbi:MAG: hypothetical protein DRP74_02720 [Candidatus Omnitrophota bacterium]|nr:MAG: hypothetical protein DRP74_02720 [Candidatus Omnitrophota bacterium]
MVRQQSFITTNIFDWSLKAFLFLAPIIWLPGFTQKSLQLLFFNYGALILFGLSISLPAKREFKNYNILILFILAVVISLIRAPHHLSISLLHIIFGCLLYYAIVRSTSDIQGVLKWFMYLALINVAFMVLQLFGINLVYGEQPKLFCGLMAMNKHLAILLAFIAPILAVFSVWALLLVGIALGMVRNYAAMLAFTAMFLVALHFQIKSWKKKILIIIPILALVVFIALPLFGSLSYKINSRLPVWLFTLKQSLGNPFIGYGLDTFTLHAELSNFRLGEGWIVETYNEYLRFIYEFGFVPFVILAYSLFSYFKRLSAGIIGDRLKMAFVLSIISILVVCFFQDALHIGRLAVPIIIIIALFEAYLLDKQNKEVIHD